MGSAAGVFAARKVYAKRLDDDFDVIERDAVAPAPTGAIVTNEKKHTPTKKEWSAERLRVRCKERPNRVKLRISLAEMVIDALRKGRGGKSKEFIPWC